MADAPEVPHESAGAVEAKLSRICQRSPVPRLHRVEQRTDVAPKPVLILYGREQNVRRWNAGEDCSGPGEDLSAVFPCALLEIAYDGVERRLRPDKPGSYLSDSHPGGEAPVVIRRDPELESEYRRAFVTAAKRHGGKHPDALRFDISPPAGVQDADIVFGPLRRGEDEEVPGGLDFAGQEVPALRAVGWRVEIDKTWPFRIYEGPVAFTTSLEASDSDWFSLALWLEANGRKFAVAPIVLQFVETLPVDDLGRLEEGFDVERHLAGRMFYARFEDGTYLAVDGARFARFAEAFLEAQGLIGFHPAEARRLFELAEALEGCGAPWTGRRELLDLGARLRSLAEAQEVPVPGALHGELRPYQRVGYGWLKLLSECGFGGVLADDMGLGKTVQTLALLAHRHLEEKTDRPSLLVVPTSLVGNWRREAARFTPDLKLLVLHGPGRLRHFAAIPDHHLVITTYPLVNRDYDALFRHDYDTAVLDEAQTVKNPAAGVTKRIRGIRARQRLALTGTPIENSLQELWSLYDWLIPGLLGNRKSFAKHYRTPIEKEGDRAKQRLLSTRIKPFLLRRTKEEVAAELPEKTVIDELVPLEEGQAALYESIRAAMDARIREAIAERGLDASRITILDALLKLRQVCCDPRLVKLDAARKVTESAKRARLLALLEELVAEGRRVLIFSPVRRDAAPRRDRCRGPRLGLRNAAWKHAGPGRSDRELPVGSAAALPDQPQGGRHGSQPDCGRYRDRLRSVVEPRGGTPSHGPGAPDRPGQARVRSSADRRAHRRDRHPQDAAAQAGPGGRFVRGNRQRSADTQRRGYRCALRRLACRTFELRISDGPAERGPAVAKPICRVRRRAAGSAYLATERWSTPMLTGDGRSETTPSPRLPVQFGGTGSVIGAE